jgi:hypothetical protein
MADPMSQMDAALEIGGRSKDQDSESRRKKFGEVLVIAIGKLRVFSLRKDLGNDAQAADG